MKNILLILFITCFFVNLKAQNWQPINSSYTYYYTTSENSNQITNTIYADSVQNNAGDSVLYLNKILVSIDWMVDWSIESQFFQDSIITDGHKYHFKGNESFVIKSNAELNETWIFDTINNITASVTIMDTITLFGNIDSIKTIGLINNGEIVLSKNNGVIKFKLNSEAKSYFLKGIDNQEKTFNIDFFDYYDFEVGDKFVYNYYKYDMYKDFQSIIREYTITDKRVTPDSIIYSISGKEMEIYQLSPVYGRTLPVCTSTSLGSNLVFINSVDHILNKQIFELGRLNNNSNYWSYIDRVYFNDSGITNVELNNLSERLDLLRIIGQRVIFNENWYLNYKFDRKYAKNKGLTYDYEESEESFYKETNLLAKNENITLIDTSIYRNEFYTVAGNTYNTTGFKYDTIQTNGQDSVIITLLEVLPDKRYFTDTTICSCDLYTVDTNTYQKSGIYHDTITVNGTFNEVSLSYDSIIISNLTVKPSYKIDIDTSFCLGEEILINGNFIKSSGIYTESLLTISGCDSIINYNIVIETCVPRNFVIYPNPTSRLIKIFGDGYDYLEIYNLEGKKLLLSTKKVNLVDLEKGVYLVLIYGENGKYETNKIIIE